MLCPHRMLLGRTHLDPGITKILVGTSFWNLFFSVSILYIEASHRGGYIDRSCKFGYGAD